MDLGIARCFGFGYNIDLLVITVELAHIKLYNLELGTL